MRGLLGVVVLAGLLGSADGQIDLATLHIRYGEPTQEVYAVRPGFHITVRYSAEHQICMLDINSGQSDSYESSKATNKVLDDIVEELIPESSRGPAKNDLIQFVGVGGQSIADYELFTINRTLLTSRASGVLHAIVRFKDKSCNVVAQTKEAASQ